MRPAGARGAGGAHVLELGQVLPQHAACAAAHRSLVDGVARRQRRAQRHAQRLAGAQLFARRAHDADGLRQLLGSGTVLLSEKRAAQLAPRPWEQRHRREEGLGGRQGALPVRAAGRLQPSLPRAEDFGLLVGGHDLHQQRALLHAQLAAIAGAHHRRQLRGAPLEVRQQDGDVVGALRGHQQPRRGARGARRTAGAARRAVGRPGAACAR
mmetsp:Transcript_16341/g.50736  ORF Transcript_16341/g.50736 Transcript_16341/m.50736 type:complete len:211 (+) Transcript_16341:287-919(+)